MPVPWLLLLDEPSEGIQPSIVQEIGEILVNLRKRDKLSLVVVEQNLDLVLDVADRIVVMERGRIEREVDAHVVHAGGLAELLGMGTMRTSRAPPGATRPPHRDAGHARCAPARLRRAPRRPRAARLRPPVARQAARPRQSSRTSPAPVATYGPPTRLRRATRRRRAARATSSRAPRAQRPDAAANHRPRPLPLPEVNP
jgi:energy-coupling factor transporter ATP-binding protein EcfA2